MLIIIDTECTACHHVKEIFIQRADSEAGRLPACEACGGKTERKYSVTRSKHMPHANACSLGFRFNYQEE